MFVFFILSRSALADYLPMGKYDLVMQSSLIAIGTVKYVEKGSFGVYKQKAYVEINSLIKGEAPKHIVILGKTWFLCDLTNFKVGKYLFFINPTTPDFLQNELFPYYVSPGFGDGVFFAKDGELWWQITDSEHKNHSLYSVTEVSKDVINISHVPWRRFYFSF